MASWLVPVVLAGVPGWSLAGCESPLPTRTWQASDHQAPPVVDDQVDQGPGREASQVDPLAAARGVWAVQCAGCHGTGGQGGGPSLPPGARVPDMRSAGWQRDTEDGAIVEVMINGRGMMPGFGETLSADALTDLLGVVRGLGPVRSASGATVDGTGDTRVGAPPAAPGATTAGGTTGTAPGAAVDRVRPPQ